MTDLDARGNYAVNETRTDMNTEYLVNLPQSHVHYKGETKVRLADEQEGYVRAYIIMPTTVWGMRHGPLVDADISNRHSQAIPVLIMRSKARGQGGVVGKGLNIWSHVEVHECALKKTFLNFEQV